MGWERKRGKIEEFVRLLRGDADTSFDVVRGDLSVLPRVRYLITLDRDTRLPRGVARGLLGIAVHPLNRARYDPAEGRVTEGYGILQPRVSVTFESAAGSLFARLYAGHTGRRPLHDRRLGHLPGPLRRGHLHRQGADRRRRVPRGARRAACPRTRSCRTTSSKASTRARRS